MLRNVEHGERYTRFLERLRQARIDAGLSQVQVSNSLGKHQSFLSKCETGERRVDIIELQELAKLYRKDISYFLGK
jgi:transcriptional regulator with XRE-family HTH domain